MSLLALLPLQASLCIICFKKHNKIGVNPCFELAAGVRLFWAVQRPPDGLPTAFYSLPSLPLSLLAFSIMEDCGA